MQSFSTLELGFWPDDSPLHGQALAGGWTGMVLWLKGDLEFFANDVGTPHWSTGSCCGLCRANKTDASFKDFRRFAGGGGVLNPFWLTVPKNVRNLLIVAAIHLIWPPAPDAIQNL